MATGRMENLKPWPPGISGNPAGRPKRKPITDAYLELLDQLVPGDRQRRTWRQKVAMAVLKQAAKGNISAAREVADRLEGKPHQQLKVSNRPSPSSLFNVFRDVSDEDLERLLEECNAMIEKLGSEGAERDPDSQKG